MKVERGQTKLINLIRDHTRRIESVETLRDLGFGFKVGPAGHVVPSLEAAVKEAMAVRPVATATGHPA
jgi:hypothetical protein